ncbi:MAG: DUF2179 domain-containing protein [Actinobacteria bacterium]|nr:DUF2179 domain-containing protein [Actinomycetota bacterium]
MDLFLSALLIFGLRLVDVSLGTIRIVLLTRGDAWKAGLVGFVESLTWVVAVSQVLGNLNDPVRMLGFAAGFGTGTFVGVMIERWLAMGTYVVRIVAPVSSPQAADALRAAGYPVTVFNGEGRDGEVRLAMSVVRRRQTKDVLRIVYEANPAAFVTFEHARLPSASLRAATSVRK